jgi:putative ABC transport system ATP-binding protein
LSGLIVPFEPGAYNPEASVLENLLFGHASRADLLAASIGGNPHFRQLCSEQGLSAVFDAMGVEIARNVIGLFADLPPDHPFFRQLTFMTSDDIPAYQLLLQKYDNPAAVLTEDDRAAMIRLSFEYIEPRYRFGLLNDDIMARIVAFRRAFHDRMPEDMRDGIEIYDPDRFMETGTLLDNVLFGRISQKFRDGADQVRAALTRLLHQEELYDDILAIGLTFDVGSGGKRISVAQRQKLGLARALVRQSDYFVFNRPLTALDARSQERIIAAVLAELRGRPNPPGIVWVVSAPALAQQFDRVAVFATGNLVENDAPARLIEKNGIFKELATA